MKRRQFVALLGGAAAAWPHDARPEVSVRHVEVLMPVAADDPTNGALVAAFEQGLAQWGWTSGRNVRIDYRWAINSTDKTNAAIAELLARLPDVIVASTSRTVAALQKAMPTVPIVFTMIEGAHAHERNLWPALLRLRLENLRLVSGKAQV